MSSRSCITAAAVLLLLFACSRCSSAFSLSPVQENELSITQHSISTVGGNGTDMTLYTYPASMYNIAEGETKFVYFDFEWKAAAAESAANAAFYITDDSVAQLHNSTFRFSSGNAAAAAALTISSGNASSSSNNATVQLLRYRLKVTGKFLGRADIHVNFNSSASTSNSFRYRISVVRKPRIIDMVFRIIIWLFVVFANTGMGCEIDLDVVKEVLKKPFAPAVGFVSQYLFMPMVSFGVLQLISLPGSTALGYFGMGCAPGGGASNFYCLLLGGDVSLSITMTLVSTVAAFGMTPLYMFTLGQLILSQNDVQINIPYVNIVITLLLILIPSVLGYLLQVKFPKVARIYRKILKPVILLFVLFMFTFGVYANLFIWKLFSPAMIAAGCALPYAGFILGGGLAAICRQPWPRVKTICLETGIQNPGVPILLLQASLPQPDADLSLVGPIAAATFTPFPLFVWVAIRMIYYRCYLKQNPLASNKNVEAELEVVEGGEGNEMEVKNVFLPKQ